MITVTLTDFNLPDVLIMINNFRTQGYTQGIDFDFSYYPEKGNYDKNFSYNITQRREVKFTFYNEHLGLLFQLGR